MHRLLASIRRNAVAWTALFVALGGTGVAAVGLANHSINPVKFNRTTVGGYVRAWTGVEASGRVAVSGGRVSVQTDSALPGRYFLRWHTRLTSPCRVIGSIDSGNGSTGYLTADLSAPRHDVPSTIVNTFGPQGQLTPQAFDVELLCATPR